MRRFEWVPGVVVEGLSLPTRQTDGSAGYDLCVCEDVLAPRNEVILAPTGVRVRCPADEFVALFPRSSLAIKWRLILANGVGVIDSDYYGNRKNEGQIYVPLWNLGPSAIRLRRGERVAQAVFMRFYTVDDEIQPGVPRAGGFGSTE